MTETDTETSRERGIALLMTLGILALILILAMSFAFTARTDATAAVRRADLAQARMLCESGLDRALTFMTHIHDNTNLPADRFPAGAGEMFSEINATNGIGSSSHWEGRSYAASRDQAGDTDQTGLGDALATNLDFSFIPERTDAEIASSDELGNTVSWHHITVEEDYCDDDGDGAYTPGTDTFTDSNGNGAWDDDLLIGRIAFLIVDESGKIDPEGVMTRREPTFDSRGYGAYPEDDLLIVDTDGNGEYTAEESFDDTNGDGQYTPAELFIDTNGDGDCNPGEPYFDADQSGDYTEAESYVDSDGSGDYTHGELHYTDINGNGSYQSTPLSEGIDALRVGVSPQEINILNAYLVNVSDPLQYQQFVENAPAWFSLRHIGRGNIDSLVMAGAAKCFLPSSDDIEAWWDGATDRHRFDLRGYNWENAAVDDILTPASNFWYSASRGITAENAGGIDWITNILDKNDNPVSNQVAANLVDYCDSDSIATTDYAGPSSTPATTPATATYVGLEKAPYINEIGLKVKFEHNDGGTTGEEEKDDDTASLSVTIAVELVNIYDTDVTVDMTTLWSKFEITEGTHSAETIDNVTVSSITVPAESYYVTELPSNGTVLFQHQWQPPTAWPIQASGTITDFSVKLTVPGQPGQIVDFAQITAGPETQNFSDSKGDDSAAEIFYGSCEVQDPRVNTVDANWIWREFDTDPAVCSLTFYDAGNPDTPSGRVNSSSDPSNAGTGDTETVSDPAAGLSTAYIRNAPMESPWELGAIHRAEPWRTINLKAYNDDPAAANYANGDARILDQVKLGGYTTGIRGKLNPNTRVREVLGALLGGLTVGATYDDPTAGETLEAAEINDRSTPDNDLVDSILNTNSTVLGSRSAIADTPAFSDESSEGILYNALQPDSGEGEGEESEPVPVTDRSQEEIIGKIVTLLSIRENYFTVIVVGQSVKDIGALDTGRSVEYATGRYCSILAEQKIMALVRRNVFTNEYRVERFETLAR